MDPHQAAPDPGGHPAPAPGLGEGDLRDYYEDLWAGVPEGLEPERARVRLDFLLSGVRAGERVLDVGCAEGHFTAALAGAGVGAVGIEIAEEPLRR
ncbi:MAG TPA: methionine biosynthesis protein MetW, partial [Solirubrobacteraceae bacterium]|nr:methionine biosynthesis protein MetW [Solirubrobacteraceae bacterium]